MKKQTYKESLLLGWVLQSGLWGAENIQKEREEAKQGRQFSGGAERGGNGQSGEQG